MIFLGLLVRLLLEVWADEYGVNVLFYDVDLQVLISFLQSDLLSKLRAESQLVNEVFQMLWSGSASVEFALNRVIVAPQKFLSIEKV